MEKEKIENLEEVLGKHIRDSKITDVRLTPLIAPGEDYGSVMLKLDVKFKTEDGTEEELHVVSKQIPKDEFTRKFFNVQVTFKNEIAMYDTIVPALQELQRECGVVDVVDYLPKLYGARINLDGKSDAVDESGALILENLKESVCACKDKCVLNCECRKSVLNCSSICGNCSGLGCDNRDTNIIYEDLEEEGAMFEED